MTNGELPAVPKGFARLPDGGLLRLDCIEAVLPDGEGSTVYLSSGVSLSIPIPPDELGPLLGDRPPGKPSKK